MVEPLSGSLAFLIEADRLKRINRQSRLIGGGRRENSAEHSWHLALFALIIGRERPINILKTLKMLLIHDLVEIDAGDTPLHGNSEVKQAQLSAEIAAAHRIFGLLPPDAQAEYLALWDEFETGESDEACFARALDRLQPLIGNLANNGGTWNENGVDEVTVLEHYGRPISTALPDLWPEIRGWVAGHFKTGPASGVRSISSVDERLPGRGIYDNMRTAIDKVGRGKERDVNVRFLAMASHYVFEPEFCNPASG